MFGKGKEAVLEGGTNTWLGVWFATWQYPL